MRHQWQLFVCALQFLTRLPTPTLKEFEQDWIARSAPYYPLVGCIVGLMSGIIFVIAHHFWSGFVSAALAIGGGILITGGFHEDGLADTADGLGGGLDRARRLAIMKDSRIGSYGTLAIGCMLSIKLVTLAAMPAWSGLFSLVIAHSMGRACAVCVMHLLPYARDPDSSKIKPVPLGVTRKETLIGLGFGLATLCLLSDDLTHAILALAFAASASLILARQSKKLIEGWTGDVLGAIEQGAELALLLGLSIRLGN